MPAPLHRSDRFRLPAVVAIGCLAVLGCSPAAPPARPGAAARPTRPAADHDHDDDHDHDHDHAAEKGPKKGDHDDHDHDHPETLAAGVAELAKMWGGIKTALKGGKLDEADDLVHEVGHLLEDLPGLVAKTKPAESAAEAGKKAIDEIFACFETIDTAVHAGEEEAKKLDLDGLATKIESAFESLSGLVK